MSGSIVYYRDSITRSMPDGRAYKIRSPEPAEYPNIIPFIQNSMRHFFKGQLDKHQISVLSDFKNSYFNDDDTKQTLKGYSAYDPSIRGTRHLIAESDGKMIGILSYGQTGKGLHIRAIYVAPAYERQGIASALFGIAEASAAKHGMRAIYGEATTQEIISLVEKRGYKIGSDVMIHTCDTNNNDLNPVTITQKKFYKHLRKEIEIT